MSTEDQRHDDDLAFEAFLRGEDELSQQIKGLPQPQPGAALDAAILASIESSLASEAQQLAAANDSVGPAGANAKQPRFNVWWNVPLGLAAGVLLTVLAQMYLQTGQSPVPVAQAPRPAPAATPLAQVAQAEVPVSPPVTTKSSAPARHQDKPASAPTQLALATIAPQAPASAAPAPKVAAAEPVQEVRVTGIRASLQQSLSVKRNAVSNVEVVTAEDVGRMPDKNVADSLQRLPGVNVSASAEEDVSGLTALELKRRAVGHIDVYQAEPAKAAPAMPKPAVVAAAPEAAAPMAKENAASGYVSSVAAKPSAAQEIPAANSRYVIKGDTVYDTKTDLTWQRCSVGQRWVEGTGCVGEVKLFTYDDAQRQGDAPWWVPTKGELATLIDQVQVQRGQRPTIDELAFPNTLAWGYWTSTSYGAEGSLYVHFGRGTSYYNDPSNTFAVRLVRGGQ